MKVTDKQGRAIEITIMGKHEDDIQIDEAYYVDEKDPEEVSDDTIDYIMQKFANEILQAWAEHQADLYEQYVERIQDRN